MSIFKSFLGSSADSAPVMPTQEQTLEEARAMLDAMPLDEKFYMVLTVDGEEKIGAQEAIFAFQNEDEKNTLLNMIDETLKEADGRLVVLTVNRLIPEKSPAKKVTQQ